MMTTSVTRHLHRPDGRRVVVHDLTPDAPEDAPVVLLSHAAPGSGTFDPEPAETAARGIRLICDAYRLDGRDEIVDVIMWWQDRCWRGIQAGAVAGDPAMVRLRNDGAVLKVRAAFRWVAGHRAELEVP